MGDDVERRKSKEEEDQQGINDKKNNHPSPPPLPPPQSNSSSVYYQHLPLPTCSEWLEDHIRDEDVDEYSNMLEQEEEEWILAAAAAVKDSDSNNKEDASLVVEKTRDTISTYTDSRSVNQLNQNSHQSTGLQTGLMKSEKKNGWGESASASSSSAMMIKRKFSDLNERGEDGEESMGAGENSRSGMGIEARLALNPNKAGMEGVDHEQANKIILEASRGSKFYENQLIRDAKVQERINQMFHKWEQIKKSYNLEESDGEEEEAEEEGLEGKGSSRLGRGNTSSASTFVGGGSMKATLQRKIDETIVWPLEKQERDFTRVIMHIDMDAFYAAVEERENPSLRDKPMAVGGMSMLSTSNYVARKYGVRSAMPGYIAKKLCPQLIIVHSHFDLYKEVSAQVQSVLAQYDPHFKAMSLDEAHLDLTPYLQERGLLYKESGDEKSEEERINGEAVERVVNEIRQKIFELTKLTASAGISCNKMLAKICSDMNKPNGQFRIANTRSAVMEFIQKLSVRKIPGVGRVSEKMLKALGIETCKDLFDKRHVIQLLFSESSFNFFLRASLGLGSTVINTQRVRKSISVERTFKDMSSPKELYEKCFDICEVLARDVGKKNIKGKCVTVKLKLSNYEVRTRASSVKRYIYEHEDLYHQAVQLIRKELEAHTPDKPPLTFRLMGVRLSSLNIETSASGDVDGHGNEKITSFFKQQASCDTDETSTSDKKPNLTSPNIDTNASSSTSNEKENKNKCHSFFKECIKLGKEQEQEEKSNSNAHGLATQSSSTDTTKKDQGKVGGTPCPICMKDLGHIGNSELNAHIDLCLNAGLISDHQPNSDSAPKTSATVATPTSLIGGKSSSRRPSFSNSKKPRRDRHQASIVSFFSSK
eukprot:Nk52_evm45s2118 gene=Nk52_evmTU45s2118